MSTHENAPPPPDWMPPVGRHCGEYCWELACPFCGEYVPKDLTPAPHIILSDN